MTGKSLHQTQRDLFQPLLLDFIDRKLELILLANKIDWAFLESHLSAFIPTQVNQPNQFVS